MQIMRFRLGNIIWVVQFVQDQGSVCRARQKSSIDHQQEAPDLSVGRVIFWTAACRWCVAWCVLCEDVAVTYACLSPHSSGAPQGTALIKWHHGV